MNRKTLNLTLLMVALFNSQFVNSNIRAQSTDANPQTTSLSENANALVAKIFGDVPQLFSVTLDQRKTHLVFIFSTDEIETTGSDYSSNFDIVEVVPFRLHVEVLPRYSDDVIDGMIAYNASIEDGNRDERVVEETSSSVLLNIPNFIDEKYGYRVSYPSQVPVNVADVQSITAAFLQIAADWKNTGVDEKAPRGRAASEMLKQMIQGRIDR